MLNLLLAVILALAFTFVALQNAALVPLRLGAFTFSALPLYFVAFASFVAGIFVSALFSLVGWTSSALTVASKNSEIAKTRALAADLKARVNQLTVENAALKGERVQKQKEVQTKEAIAHDQAHLEDRPHAHLGTLSFWDRLRYRLAV